MSWCYLWPQISICGTSCLGAICRPQYVVEALTVFVIFCARYEVVALSW